MREINDKIKILSVIYFWFMSYGAEFGFGHVMWSSFMGGRGEDTDIYLGNASEKLLTYRSYLGETIFIERESDA